MPTSAIQRQVRFLDVARAFSVLAANPDKALDLALEVSEDTITVIESNLHGVAKRLNGDPMALEIEALLTHPFREPQKLQVVRERDVAAEGELPRFVWNPIQRPGAPLGDLNSAFVCEWGGLSLKIEKKGPADYEGFIGGEYFARSKFKKQMRERLEKEAAKRVGA